MAGDSLSEAAVVLLTFIDRIEVLGLQYVVVGSVASSIHGEPRMTRDADVLLDLPHGRTDAFFAALRPDFYIPETTAREAIAASSVFGLIHMATMFKIDVCPLGRNPQDRDQLQHRLRVPLVAGGSQAIWVLTPEMVVVSKLGWYLKGGSVSDQQWRDVLGVLKVQRGRLDLPWLRHRALRLGLADELQRALREAGLAEGTSRPD